MNDIQDNVYKLQQSRLDVITKAMQYMYATFDDFEDHVTTRENKYNNELFIQYRDIDVFYIVLHTTSDHKMSYTGRALYGNIESCKTIFQS